MLRLSANLTLLYPDLPLGKRFDMAKAAGYAGVEIQFPYDTPITELHDAMARTGLPIVLINIPAADLLQSGDGLACVPARQHEWAGAVEQALLWAQALNVPTVNLLAGRQPAGLSRETCLQTLVDNARHASSKLAEHGIRVVCEAINTHDMPGYLLPTSRDLAELLSRVNHPNLGMQLDLYHMARMGEDIASVLTQQAAHIGHLQFADVPGRGAPGTGSLDFPALFRLIAQLPYHGWCGAEYRRQADDPDWMSNCLPGT
ncbi:MAG TPA: TIM barrel protein [Chromobacteriaceae bacterium]|nr:TIM barrel protein [Chromobacteriaceae bacterium]